MNKTYTITEARRIAKEISEKLDTTQHTPGPWIIGTYDNATYQITGPKGALPIIAKIPSDRIECPHNARLISAAPELLAALAWALDQIEDSLDPDHQAALDAARAALAKAKGE